MSTQITPNEMHLLQDNPTIRTKCPVELVTDAMVGKEIRRANLVAGDVVRVQCMSHDYGKLLAEAEYRVVQRTAVLRTVEKADLTTHQVEEVGFRVARVTEWRTFGAQPAPMAAMSVEWNVGKRGYNIKAGDAVVGFHEDKETAHAMAAGKLPLPKASEAA